LANGSPELTTIVQEREKIGYIAAERLLAAIEDGVEETNIIYVPTRLAIRKSCRRL
jgi:DNA-binding LacI/PurR family transcriptional regulator